MKSAIRFSASFVAALVLTGSIFWFLHTMIGRHSEIQTIKALPRIEFSRLRRDTEVQTRRAEKARLDMKENLPTPQMSLAAGPASGGPALSVPIRDTSAGSMGSQKITLSKMTAGSDRDVVPLVRIEPEYPIRAAQRGIEGWVLLRFTITPIGTVKDVQVVDSSPKGVFDDAAVRAVLRWKYNPKVEEGTAVERRGVQVVLRFALEKDQ